MSGGTPSIWSDDDLPARVKLKELWSSAGYIAKDPDLWNFKRFKMLHLFNILTLQERLTYLETKLLLKTYGSSESLDLDRITLDIQATLKEYGRRKDLEIGGYFI
jgi:hypothetical protein